MTTPTTAYLICTNPRSGSWLLSEGLSATGVAGHPREWFQVEEQRCQSAAWGLPAAAGDAVTAAYLGRVLERGTTPNGVFGAKVMGYQLRDLPGRVAAGDSAYRHDSAWFPQSMLPDLRYVWLRRRDSARQAISYYRAARTDVWWQLDDADADAPPPFDPAEVARLERDLLRHDAAWRDHFAAAGVTPLELFYESLADDYAGQIGRVLAWLGVAADGPVPPPRLRRQADGVTERWLTAYAAWTAAGPAGPEVKPDMDAQTSPVVIDAEWRRWVAENVLLGKGPDTIVAAMVGAGVDPAAAATEVGRAGSHPYLVAARQWTGGGSAAADAALLRKRDWVLACQSKSARLSPATSTGVPRVRTPSRQAFLDDFYAANRPAVIEGAMDDWPAVAAWTLDALKRRLGSAVVEVQSSRESDPDYERNAAKLKRRMPFADYVDAVAAAGPTNDLYITANNAGVNRSALAPLWADVGPLAEYLRPDPDNHGFFWFGPAGTVTPLHHDLTNNFMAQVRGRKRVRLIAPWELPRLYNDRHCYSQVDLSAPDVERHPLFAGVPVADVTIGPRDLLFLPVGWWHHVQSLDVSITMTFTNFAFDNDFASFYSWP